MSIKHLSVEEIGLEINNDLTIVSLTAPWCGACQMMSPIYEELAQKFNVIKLDVEAENNKEWAKKYNVTSLPTILIFKNGNLIDRIEGYTPSEVCEARIMSVF